MTTEPQDKPKIFAFCNGGSPGWYRCDALSEDGVFLAGHICSDPGWGLHDLGVTSEWKHETYRKYYPDGFEVIGVEVNDPRLLAAHERHKAHTPEEYAAKIARIGEPETPRVEVEFTEDGERKTAVLT